MRRTFVAAVSVTCLALALLAAPAGAALEAGGAEVRGRSAEHQRIVNFWTAERRASAKPRDIALPFGAKVQPKAKPGTGSTGGDVLGASWTGGGSVAVTTGKVFFTSGGSRYVCSGSAVESAHNSLVLTAGHCVHDGGPAGQYVTNWIFYPRYKSGADPVLGAWTAADGDLFATTNWTTKSGAYEDDAAFAQVSNPNYTSLEAAVASQNATTPLVSFSHPADGTKIHSFGYPAARPYNGATLIYCSGSVTTGYDGRQTLSIPCDMTGGSSGGPWYHSFNTTTGTGTLTSVNSYGYQTIKNRMFGPILDAPEKAAFTAAGGY